MPICCMIALYGANVTKNLVYKYTYCAEIILEMYIKMRYNILS